MTDSLPKPLAGVVCSQMVRCGKVGCKCQRGRLHGPYYYRFWRENGRLRKQYVPRSQLESVRARCDQRRDKQRTAAKAIDLAQELTQSIRKLEDSIHDDYRNRSNP